MRKRVIALTILCMFAFNVGTAGVFADEAVLTDAQSNVNTTATVEVEINDGKQPAEIIIIEVEPGTTPDQTFYSLKKLFENVQLFLTFSAEDKAALLAEFAEKRLAEAQAMDEAAKMELVKEMVEEYAKNLIQAQEKAESSLEEGQSLVELIEKIEKLLDDNIKIIQKVKSDLPELEEKLAVIKENLEYIKTASEIVDELDEEEDVVEQEEDADKEKDEDENTVEEDEDKETTKETVSLEGLTLEEQITALRTAGYGFGEINIALSLAEKADVSIDEVIKLRNAGLGWGNISKELNVTKRDVAKKICKLILEAKGQYDYKVKDEKTEKADSTIDNKSENKVEAKAFIKNEIKNKMKELKFEQKKFDKEYKQEIKDKREEMKSKFKAKQAEWKAAKKCLSQLFIDKYTGLS